LAIFRLSRSTRAQASKDCQNSPARASWKRLKRGRKLLIKNEFSETKSASTEFFPVFSLTGRENTGAPASLLAAGDRVGIVAAGRQPILVPAAAAVLGAEDLTDPGNPIDLVRVAGVERDAHHCGLSLEHMVETLPAAAEILALVNRPIPALR